MIAPPADSFFVRTTLSLDDAASCREMADLRHLLRASSHPRPAPHFIYGPQDPNSLRHFHNDQYQPPASVAFVRDVDVLGPWFITGALLVRGEVDFRCDGIALDPETEESRARLREHLTATAEGRRTTRHVPGQTVLLATNGHQIYGHWLVDFLPKLHLIELAGLDLHRVRVLLPSNMGEFGEAFLRLLGLSDEQFVRYDPDRETIHAEELVVPTTLRWGGRCSPLFADAVACLNERLDRFGRLPTPSLRRAFLSRVPGGRPLVNQDRIETLAAAAGLTVVHPERMPLVEQIALFRGVRRVVGQYGSALHATIFSRPGVVVGGLHGPLPATFDALQSGIAERLGQPTGYVFGTAASGHGDAWAMTVAEADLAACLAAEFTA